MKLHYKSVNRGRISFGSDWPKFVWQSDIFPDYKIEVWRGVYMEVDIEEITVSAQNYIWDYIWENYERLTLQDLA